MDLKHPFVLMILFAFQGLSVEGQTTCNVAAIQACTMQYASQIGNQQQPTTEVICSAYAAIDRCLEPHKVACSGNFVYRQFVRAQASIAQQCEAVNNDDGCDATSITSCLTTYTSAVRGAQTRLQTCRFRAELSNCMRPHSETCREHRVFQSFTDIMDATRDTCGDPNDRESSNCNVQSISECLRTYTSEVDNARTRLRTCRLVWSLKDCMRPHAATCREDGIFQEFIRIANATRDTCGGPGDNSGSGCDSNMINTARSCMSQYRTATRSDPQTRLRTCRAFSALVDCFRDLERPCERHAIMRKFRKIQQAMSNICTETDRTSYDCVDWNNTAVPNGEIFSPNRNDLCNRCTCINGAQRYCKDVACQPPDCEGAVPIEGVCCEFICPAEIATPPIYTGMPCTAIANCAQYITKISQFDGSFQQPNASHLIEICNSLSDLQTCLQPLAADCSQDPSYRSIQQAISAVSGFCGHGGTCDTIALASCAQQMPPMTEFESIESITEEQRELACNSLSRMQACIQPLAESCSQDTTYQSFQHVITNTLRFCETGRPSSTCLDWNNTIIQNGERFHPDRSEPCHRCMCIHGESRYCMDVACEIPQCEEGDPIRIEGTCCGFTCPSNPPTTPSNLENLECPDGWSRHGSKCYYVSREKFNWINAQMICETLDGKLVEISSEDENEFVKNFTKSSGVVNFWIGVTDLEVDGTYKFPKAIASVAFDDWGRRALPMSKAKNCVEIIGKGRRTYWRPASCRRKIYFVCERSLV